MKKPLLKVRRGCLQYLLAQVMEQNLLEPRNWSAGAYFPQYSHFRRFAFLSSSEKQSIPGKLHGFLVLLKLSVCSELDSNYSQNLPPKTYTTLKHKVQVPESQNHVHFSLPILKLDYFYFDYKFYPNSHFQISAKTAFLNRREELITNA